MTSTIDMRLRPPYGAFLSTSIFRWRPGSYGAARADVALAESVVQESMEKLVQEMDEAGIDVGVVMGRHAAPPWGVVPTSDIVAVVEGHPDRFIGFAGIDVEDVEGSLDCAKKYVTSGLIRGISLEPGIGTVPLKADDPRLDGVYRFCVEHNMPVSVSLSGNMGPDLSYSDPSPLVPVARRYPDLTVILSHGSWPWVMQAVGVAFACPNVYLSPDLYMLVPNLPGADAYLQAANSFLADRILFGSAYPIRPLDVASARARELGVSDPDAFLFGNAARLLNVQLPQR